MSDHNPETAAFGYQGEWEEFRKHRNRIFVYFIFEFFA